MYVVKYRVINTIELTVNTEWYIVYHTIIYCHRDNDISLNCVWLSPHNHLMVTLKMMCSTVLGCSVSFLLSGSCSNS